MNNMTMSQTILAKRSGYTYVSTDDLIMCDIDVCMGNDITAPVTVDILRRNNKKVGIDPDKIVFVADHFVPCRDIRSAENCKVLREFSKENSVKNFFDVGHMGIEHCLLPEKGFIHPTELIIGADSHTCTYGALNCFSTGIGSTDLAYGIMTGKIWFKVPGGIKFNLTGKLAPHVSGKDVILYIIGMIGVNGATYKSMEFCGPGVSCLSIDDRFTICNMAVEAGAKNGIFIYDTVTDEYVKKHVKEGKSFEYITEAPEDSCYERVYNIKLEDIGLLAACPDIPSNVKLIRSINETHVDQVIIGSCTNGRISDLEAAASVFESNTVSPKTRCIIIPGTQDIYLEAVKKGYIETFIKAGCAVSTPTCGPCLGGHMGVMASGEVAVSTTNRNFVGRMGAKNSSIYLTGPYAAAICAVQGKIGESKRGTI